MVHGCRLDVVGSPFPVAAQILRDRHLTRLLQVDQAETDKNTAMNPYLPRLKSVPHNLAMKGPRVDAGN